MIILGDIAIPDENCAHKLRECIKANPIFEDEPILFNLEGVLFDRPPQDTFWRLYNHISVLDVFSDASNIAVSLANNHVYDYPKNIDYTIQYCQTKGVGTFGLRSEGENFAKPYEFTSKGLNYAIFGHCWQLYTLTNSNKETTHRIEDSDYETVFEGVKKYINMHPDVKVICYFHWNFDFEDYAFPAYVKLSHDLIDAGAEAVIGNHTHCVQQYEMYKGKIIAYSQGNFYLPSGYYFNGKLNYSEPKSHKTIAIRLDELSGNVNVYEFETDGGNVALKYIRECAVTTQNWEGYDVTFKKKRVKRKLVPVFYDYTNTASNKAKLFFLIARVNFIRFVKKIVDRFKK